MATCPKPDSENVASMNVQGKKNAVVSQQSQNIPLIEQDSNRVLTYRVIS